MEERITNEVTGGQKGRKRERHSLIPIKAMDHVARLYNEGTKKYSDHNWRLGYDWSLSYDALERHLHNFWDGEDFVPDDDTGEPTDIPHLAAVVFHALSLLTFMEEHPELDDRPNTSKPSSPNKIKWYDTIVGNGPDMSTWYLDDELKYYSATHFEVKDGYIVPRIRIEDTTPKPPSNTAKSISKYVEEFKGLLKNRESFK